MRKMQTISGLGLAAALALTVPAAGSAADSGFYTGLGLGANFLRDSAITDSGTSTGVDFDAGWAGAAAFGYRFSNGFRPELEIARRQNDVDKVGGAANGSGELNASSLMLNLMYDFDLGNAWRPYLGAGVGLARTAADGIQPINGGRVTGTDDVLAYQGIAGVAYEISRSVELFADYRYFKAEDSGWASSNGTTASGEYDAHTAMLGFRIFFGQPAPAPKVAAAPPAPKPQPQPAPAPKPMVEKKPEPAPAPAPQVARTYLVFFDWDSAALTPEAQSIVNSAAANSKIAKVVRIELTGHADRSGPDRYNLGLSQRRAEAVQAELVRLGVPANEIGVAWKGEREPLVPTPDGVREPQNRRVEIVFR